MTDSAARKLILIADTAEGAEAVKKYLSRHHDLVLVHGLAAATRLIANVDFDAIICGTHFDDSRMVELLREVRRESRYSGKPFIVVRMLPTNLSADIERNTKQMAMVLGATAYLPVDEFGGDGFSEELLLRINEAVSVS